MSIFSRFLRKSPEKKLEEELSKLSEQELTEELYKGEGEVAELQNKLGLEYAKHDAWQEAIEAYQQGLAYRHDHDELHYNLAKAYISLERYEEALEHIENALRVKPESGLYQYASNLYSTFWDEIRDMSKEIKLYALKTKLALVKYEFAESRNKLGQKFTELEDWETAILAYLEGIESAPNHDELHYNLGVAYINLGRSKDALEEYKILLNLKKDELAGKLFSMIDAS